MTINFMNHSRQIVILQINDASPVFLRPGIVEPVMCHDSAPINVSVKPTYESHIVRHLTKSKLYNLVIESDFILAGIADGETFHITQEKVQFHINAFYDRIFLVPTSVSLIEEHHKVLAEEKIKRSFNTSWLISLLFTGPLETLTGGIFLVLIVGIVLSIILGWKFAVVYFPSAYLLLVTLNWLIEVFWTKIGKKACNGKSEKQEFSVFFTSEFIKNYFANPNRRPFWE